MSKYKAESFVESLNFAIRGILLSLKSQRNFQIEILIAIVAFILAWYLNFTPVESVLLILTVTQVLFAELINTVVEFVVDAYFGNKYSILAKMAKDISAGAVLIVAVLASVVGALLFVPKIFNLFY